MEIKNNIEYHNKIVYIKEKDIALLIGGRSRLVLEGVDPSIQVQFVFGHHDEDMHWVKFDACSDDFPFIAPGESLEFLNYTVENLILEKEKQEGENEMGYSKVSDENLEKNIHEIGEKNVKIQDAVFKYALQIRDIVKPIYNAFNVGNPNCPEMGKPHFEIGKKEISLPKGYYYSENRLYKKSGNVEIQKYEQTNLLDGIYTIYDAEIFIKDIESGLIDAVKNSIQKQNEKRDSILGMVAKLEGG